MAWTYFEFLHICGFFVHQWNITLDNLFRVGYVRISLLHNHENPVLSSLMCWSVRVLNNDLHTPGYDDSPYHLFNCYAVNQNGDLA